MINSPTVSVFTGFTDLTAAKNDGTTMPYAILLSDTVVVTPGGTPPDVATATAQKSWKDVAYYLNAEKEESGEAEESEEGDEEAVAVRKSARTEQVDFKAREEER